MQKMIPNLTELMMKRLFAVRVGKVLLRARLDGYRDEDDQRDDGDDEKSRYGSRAGLGARVAGVLRAGGRGCDGCPCRRP